MDTSEKIKIIKKEMNLTLKDMAELLDLNPNTLSSYLNGQRQAPVPFLKLLCLKLNVNPNWLLCDTGSIFKADADNESELEDLINQRYNLSEKDKAIIKKLLQFIDETNS